MGWWITLGVATLLAVLPLGLGIRFDAGGLAAKAILGPVQITLYPRPKKKEKTQKPPEVRQETPPGSKPAPEHKQTSGPQNPSPAKPEPAPQLPKNPEPPPTPKQEGGSLKAFLPLVKVGLDLLNSLRRKLRVDVLECKLILAGWDPCDLAVNYGRTWAAVGNLMAQLERFFVIKKRDVEVECDFTSQETRITARLDLTITLGRLIALAVVFGTRAFKEYLQIQKQRKGGANP